MVNKIRIFGDSWSYGSGLADPAKNNFGQILADKKTINCVNHAQRGSSHREILETFKKVDCSDSYVIIGLTSPYRDVIPLNKDLYQQNSIRHRLLLKDATKTGPRGIYLKHFFNETYAEEQCGIYLSSLIFELQLKKIPFLVFETFARLPKNFYTQEIHQSTNFLRTSFLEHITGQQPIQENDQLQPHENLTRDFHPNEKGHLLWAEFLSDHIAL